MDRLHRSILICLRDKIVQDLDVRNGIIDQLTADYLLKDEDVDQIYQGTTPKKEAEILLDLLVNRGPYAFEGLKQALRHHYSWLSDEMDQLSRPGSIDAHDTIITRTPMLPPVSTLIIPRKHKIEQLKNALRKLNPGRYVVIHGMKGFGRSCLANRTLTDTVMIRNLFNYQIFWIQFGCKNPVEDEILNRLNYLYHCVRNDPYASTNGNGHGFSQDELSAVLRNYFNTEQHRNSLLVLDDVWDKAIIETFDFNCKTLVITTDIELLGDRPREVIEMKNGFTESESLTLFAKVLDVKVSDLPQEAKDIHHECNGMPILISMFAAQFPEFKDEMTNDDRRWRWYLRSLRNKDTTNEVIRNFLDKQETIFEMCIDRLPEKTKIRYRNLAIFSEDVNISTKTLELMWNEDTHSVDEQMKYLCRKSLVVKQWSNELKSYIYGIHDLLLCHMRKKLTAEQLSNMHREFIEKCRNYCHGDFSKLPKDNYSFSYIGYHLEQANLLDEFEDIYLDFNFLCAKICNSGLNDLLIDLKKYRRYIVNDKPDIETKLVDLETFAKAQVKILAEHRRRGCLDFIQIGINHNRRGYFYETAKKLAESQSSYLYVCHEQQNPREEVHNGEEVPIDLTTVNFTENQNQILLGTNYGDIILWDTKTRRQSQFCGHKKSKILKVILSQRGNFFLALSDQGVIKRFPLNPNIDEDVSNNEDGPLHTPRDKQVPWNSFFKFSEDQSMTTYDMSDRLITDITDIALSQDDSKLAACSHKGFFRVWDINGEILCTKQAKIHATDILAFAYNYTLLFLVEAESSAILTYRLSDNVSYDYLSIYRPVREKNGITREVSGRKMIYFRDIPTDSRSQIRMLLVTDLEVINIEWTITDHEHITNPSTRWHVCIDTALNPGNKIIAATLTHRDEWIVIADAEGTIKVYDSYNDIEPAAFYPGKATALDTFCLDVNAHLIIAGSNQLVYKYFFQCESNLPQSIRSPKYDALMKTADELDIVVQVMDKKIGVFEGHTLIAHANESMDHIIDLNVCEDGDQILYVIKKGHLESFTYEIRIFNYRTKTDKFMRKLLSYKGPIRFLKVNGSNVPVWKEGENLRIAMASNVWSEAKATGNVINFHTIKDKYVITVADNGKIIIWEVIDTDWQCIRQLPGGIATNFCFSILNSQEDRLAILKSQGEVRIYNIENDDEGNIHIKGHVKRNFLKTITCCSFSPDGRFLALGMDDGLISIYDVTANRIFGDLSLHCNSVLQLHWAPDSIGLPILLSVNCEDIAWWNIALLQDEKKLNKLSRTGMQRSSTTPTFGMSPRGSLRLSGSQSATADLSGLAERLEKNGIRDDDVEKMRQFWSSKVAKYDNKPALLGLIQLPHSCRLKVCVSSDFKRFLLVDIYGSINTYKFFGL